jgi:hypothetical protein
LERRAGTYKAPSCTRQSGVMAAVQDWPSEPIGSPVKDSKYSAKPPSEIPLQSRPA